MRVKKGGVYVTPKIIKMTSITENDFTVGKWYWIDSTDEFANCKVNIKSKSGITVELDTGVRLYIPYTHIKNYREIGESANSKKVGVNELLNILHTTDWVYINCSRTADNTFTLEAMVRGEDYSKK